MMRQAINAKPPPQSACPVTEQRLTEDKLQALYSLR
jgi:hypothetical protein